VTRVPSGRGKRWSAGLAPHAPALAVLVLQFVFFPAPPGIVARGVIVGGLTALLALGMALTYRANRIVNFAQADLGAVPAVIAVSLVSATGGYVLGLVAGLVVSVVLGAAVQLVIIRRFASAPRLLLTVATIGVSQLLAAVALLLPDLWGDRLVATRIDPPFDLAVDIHPIALSANDLIALVVAPAAMVMLALFLLRTRIGTAIRASAERADRAATLGIPVQRLHVLVWSVAALLAFVALFLRAGILGLPIGSGLTLGVLLRALAALMLGRLTHLPAVATSAVALGVLELGVSWNVSSPLLLDPILAVVVIVALVARRPGTGRVDITAASSWRAAEDVRPIPGDVARLAVVRTARLGGAGLALAAALWLPLVLDVESSLKASAVIIYAILGVSVVVLTGWSGQVSLAQVAFFALGAAVGGKATSEWGLDLTLAVLLCVVVGALVAALVGLPALRLQGLHLAVTTLAFALAMSSFLLNDRFVDWLPRGRVPRGDLLGSIDISSPTAYYYVCLAGLLVCIGAVVGIRRSAAGRAIVAVRESDRVAQSFGVSAMRTKLLAFAISGAVAAFAGCLFVHHQQGYPGAPFATEQNLAVFMMVVVGGVGSVTGAVLGALALRGAQWFLPIEWQILASGVGTLLILLLFPGGIAGALVEQRDVLLRRVARRHGLQASGLIGIGDRPGTDDLRQPLPTDPPVPVAATAPRDLA
jgi:branched-chain amino acid transport system permease protein